MSAPDSITPSPFDDKHYTKGDIDIISSDCVRFKIQLYYLQAHSKPLVALVAICQDPSTSTGTAGGNTIELYDEELETSSQLRTLLDYMTGKCVPDIATVSAAELHNLMLLASKYDCTLLLASLPILIRSRLADSSSRANCEPAILFAIAAAFELEALAGLIVAVFPTERDCEDWGDYEDSESEILIVKEGPNLDLGDLPLSIFQAIPVAYLWSFTQASARKKNPKQRAKEFLRLMRVASSKEQGKEEAKKRKVMD